MGFEALAAGEPDILALYNKRPFLFNQSFLKSFIINLIQRKLNLISWLL